MAPLPYLTQRLQLGSVSWRNSCSMINAMNHTERRKVPNGSSGGLFPASVNLLCFLFFPRLMLYRL